MEHDKDGGGDNLATCMLELGYSCTSDEIVFRGVTSRCPAIDEQVVAEVVGVMARTHAGLAADQLGGFVGLAGSGPDAAASQWNYSVVVDVLKSLKPDLNWNVVAERFDHDGFLVPDAPGFALLSAAYKRGAGEQAPIKALVSRAWRNALGQLSLLRQATAAPPDVYTFEAAERKLPTVEGLQGGRSSAGTPNHAWLCVDLYEVLRALTDAGHFATVRTILEQPAKSCPEVLILGVAAMPGDWGLMQREVCGALLPVYLSNASPNSSVILSRLWAMNQELVIEVLVEFYSHDHTRILRILEICHELQALLTVLDVSPAPFALELAAAASSKELLSLDKWVNEKLSRDVASAATFLQAIIVFLDLKSQAGEVSKVPLSQDALRTLLRLMQQVSGAGALPAELVPELQRVQQQCAKAFPALVSTAAQGSQQFASDVEEEANSYFQKIYSEAKPIEEVVAMLQRFKTSTVARDQEVFACMIHNLFDEYRFFPRYPEKELHITALLFGALVQHQLVTNITLGIALRYVLDALKRPPGTKMFAFGVDALRQFVPSLNLWPAFCVQALQVFPLREADPELYKRLEAAVRDAAPAAAAAAAADGPTAATAAGQQAPGAVGPAGVPLLGVPVTAGGGSSEPRHLFDAPMDAGTPKEGDAKGKEGGGAGMMAPPGWQPLGARRDDKDGAPGGKAGGEAGGGLMAGAGAGAGTSGAPGVGSAGAGAVGPLVASRIDSSMGDMDDKEGSLSLAAQVASSSLMPASGKDAPSLTALVNTESLESAAEKYRDFKEPPPSMLDKILFVMNNLSINNVDGKVADIKERVFPDYVPWFANYLVVRRAAQEANYHGLYVQLCDKLGDKELYRALVRTTLYYVKILLYSERTVKESNDRALLKNLGVWLGLLTFAKNKPVLSKELELKQIIIEAYQRGRLIAVLPFMQKLLECCRESKVFKHTNPMISGILSLLAELHSLKGLKINNAFCIELVFKAFGVTAEDVKPTDMLRMLPRERQCNPDWGMENLGGDAEGSTPLGGAGAGAHGAGHGHMGSVGDASKPSPPGSQAQAAAAGGSSASMQSAIAAVRASLPPLVPHGQDPKSVSGGMADGVGGPGSHAGGLPLGPGGAGAAGGAGGLPGHASGAGGAGAGAGVEHSLLGNLSAFVTISPQLAQLSDRLSLKRLVPAAVDRAILEILTPVVERSVTIACYTTVELLMKDFAMDPDEARMRGAAHLMVSTLAGSLALVTCKDPLRVSLTNALKAQLGPAAASAAVPGLAPDMLERIVAVLVQDNLDLGCSVIERAATEKAMRDVDKLLQPCYDERAKARMQGKPFADTSSFHGRFPASLPEGLRLRPGQINPQMLRVYEDFQRTPRLAPPMSAFGPAGTLQQQQQAQAQAAQQQQQLRMPGGAGGELLGGGAAAQPGGDKAAGGAAGAAGTPGGSSLQGLLHPSAASDVAFIERYLLWQGRADAAIQSKEAEGPGTDQTHLQQLLQELSGSVAEAGPAAEEVVLVYARRLLKHLAEGGTKLHTTFYVACLEALTLSPGGKRLPEELAKLVAEDDGRVGKKVVEMLVRARLLSLAELDAGLAKALAAGASKPGRASLPQLTDLLLHLAKACIVRDQALAYGDLAKSLDMLQGLAARSPGNEAILQTLDQARKASQLAAIAVRPPAEIPAVVRDKADPAGLREQVISLFEEWLRVLASGPDDKAITAYLHSLRSAGMLEMDESGDRAFRLMLELTVAHALSGVDAAAAAAGQGGARPADVALVPMAIDALVRLVCAIMSHGGGEPFLSRFLSLLVGVVKRDADALGTLFNGRPFLRILAGLLVDLATPEAQEAPWGGPRLQASLALALHALQPISVPGFAFAWLELVAHRALMPRLLSPQAGPGGPALYEALLLSLLKFLEPYLRVAELSESVRGLYKGSLRLLLVLLHDFPEFLCEHHHTLCDAIPPSCVQMRNLILSAFPRNMRLPDPFTPNLKVDLLAEVQVPPLLQPEPERLVPEQLRAPVDAYLRQRTPATLPADLAKRLLLLPAEATAAGSSYNVPTLNALVLYIGASVGSVSSALHPAALDLYLRLVQELEAEGRYLLLNAIANQLRYPNSHTHYFSCVLLSLFSELKAEAVKEQITRVLLERLIVNRPHPWGLLITFIELIKNPRYNFWSHEFTRCAPDIERLFKSVANSCMGPMKGDQQQGALGGQAGAAQQGTAVQGTQGAGAEEAGVAAAAGAAAVAKEATAVRG